MAQRKDRIVSKCAVVRNFRELSPSRLNIGWRSGVNVLAGRNIRIDADGLENFSDYLTTPEPESECGSGSSSTVWSTDGRKRPSVSRPRQKAELVLSMSSLTPLTSGSSATGPRTISNLTHSTGASVSKSTGSGSASVAASIGGNGNKDAVPSGPLVDHDRQMGCCGSLSIGKPSQPSDNNGPQPDGGVNDTLKGDGSVVVPSVPSTDMDSVDMCNNQMINVEAAPCLPPTSESSQAAADEVISSQALKSSVTAAKKSSNTSCLPPKNNPAVEINYPESVYARPTTKAVNEDNCQSVHNQFGTRKRLRYSSPSSVRRSAQKVAVAQKVAAALPESVSRESVETAKVNSQPVPSTLQDHSLQAKPSASSAVSRSPQSKPSASSAVSHSPQSKPSASNAVSHSTQSKPSASSAVSHSPQSKPSASSAVSQVRDTFVDKSGFSPYVDIGKRLSLIAPMLTSTPSHKLAPAFYISELEALSEDHNSVDVEIEIVETAEMRSRLQRKSTGRRTLSVSDAIEIPVPRERSQRSVKSVKARPRSSKIMAIEEQCSESNVVSEGMQQDEVAAARECQNSVRTAHSSLAVAVADVMEEEAGKQMVDVPTAHVSQARKSSFAERKGRDEKTLSQGRSTRPKSRSGTIQTNVTAEVSANKFEKQMDDTCESTQQGGKSVGAVKMCTTDNDAVSKSSVTAALGAKKSLHENKSMSATRKSASASAGRMSEADARSVVSLKGAAVELIESYRDEEDVREDLHMRGKSVNAAVNGTSRASAGFMSAGMADADVAAEHAEVAESEDFGAGSSDSKSTRKNSLKNVPMVKPLTSGLLVDGIEVEETGMIKTASTSNVSQNKSSGRRRCAKRNLPIEQQSLQPQSLGSDLRPLTDDNKCETETTNTSKSTKSRTTRQSALKSASKQITLEPPQSDLASAAMIDDLKLTSGHPDAVVTIDRRRRLPKAQKVDANKKELGKPKLADRSSFTASEMPACHPADDGNHCVGPAVDIAHDADICEDPGSVDQVLSPVGCPAYEATSNAACKSMVGNCAPEISDSQIRSDARSEEMSNCLSKSSDGRALAQPSVKLENRKQKSSIPNTDIGKIDVCMSKSRVSADQHQFDTDEMDIGTSDKTFTDNASVVAGHPNGTFQSGAKCRKTSGRANGTATFTTTLQERRLSGGRKLGSASKTSEKTPEDNKPVEAKNGSIRDTSVYDLQFDSSSETDVPVPSSKKRKLSTKPRARKGRAVGTKTQVSKRKPPVKPSSAKINNRKPKNSDVEPDSEPDNVAEPAKSQAHEQEYFVQPHVDAEMEELNPANEYLEPEITDAPIAGNHQSYFDEAAALPVQSISICRRLELDAVANSSSGGTPQSLVAHRQPEPSNSFLSSTKVHRRKLLPSASSVRNKASELHSYSIESTQHDDEHQVNAEPECIAWSDIVTWTNHPCASSHPSDDARERCSVTLDYAPDLEVSGKISLWKGDITSLQVDAIVNAANASLLGGGGVDGAIHKAAGPELRVACRRLKGCHEGDAKTTKGYKLPADYVIHTVGPGRENRQLLESCYRRCLDEFTNLKLQSLAFPCIATGIYGYPQEKAANVALATVRDWLDKLKSENKLNTVDRIIFCVFTDDDLLLYESLMHVYFPCPRPIVDSRHGGIEPKNAVPSNEMRRKSVTIVLPPGANDSSLGEDGSMSLTVLPRYSTASPLHYFEMTHDDTELQTIKKRHGNKILVPEETEDGLRRSKRTRVKPLDWYRNERIHYERRKSGFVVVGIESPEPLERKGLATKTVKAILRAEKRKQKSHLPQTPRNLSVHEEISDSYEAMSEPAIPVLNFESNEEVLMECIKTCDQFAMLNEMGELPKPSDALVICKPLRHQAFACGYLCIRPHQVKPPQYVRNDTLVFSVCRGKLELTIHRTRQIIESGDMFCVPAGNTYSIRNLRDDEAKLFFNQIRH